MSELLEFTIAGTNIIPTTLFIFVMIYWFVVILGVVDMDSLDVDLDIDTEISGFTAMLSFFNIGHMPLMIFVTFFTIPLWIITLTINDFLGFHNWLPQLMILGPAIICCLFISKFLTTPIAKFYRNVRKNTEAVENIVGRMCTAKLKITSDRLSQAEIKVGGTSVLISVKTLEQHCFIEIGQTALIIEQSADQNYYIVEPYIL